jgi:hypothetical protein
MKFWIALILFLFSFSCSNKQEGDNKPNVMLSKLELIDLIIDVQLLESQYHSLYQRPEVYANALDSSTYYIFKNHNTTKQIYKDNLLYWTNQPDSLYSIYEAALDSVNNRINVKR